MPIVLLGPGTDQAPQVTFEISGFAALAASKRFAVAVLVGLGDNLNVEQFLRSDHARPDDVAYTEAVVSEVGRHVCIDRSRVFCTGYSRGGRFCSRLASELSGLVRAIAPVSGVRFPMPNNATRPMPILAIHGTLDPINPYNGKGNPRYWTVPVPVAVSQWAAFNKCKGVERYSLSSHVAMERHTGCAEGAEVVLATMLGGGHTWPGSRYSFKPQLFGPKIVDISASELMWQFFMDHADKPAPPGSPVPAVGAAAALPAQPSSRGAENKFSAPRGVEAAGPGEESKDFGYKEAGLALWLVLAGAGAALGVTAVWRAPAMRCCPGGDAELLGQE